MRIFLSPTPSPIPFSHQKLIFPSNSFSSPSANFEITGKFFCFFLFCFQLHSTSQTGTSLVWPVIPHIIPLLPSSSSSFSFFLFFFFVGSGSHHSTLVTHSNCLSHTRACRRSITLATPRLESVFFFSSETSTVRSVSVLAFYGWIKERRAMSRVPNW